MVEMKTYYYQDGNTVRKIETYAAPATRHRNLPTREQREREKAEERARAAKIAARRQQAKIRKNKLMTAYMVMVVALSCVLFVGYVSLQNSITTRMNHIATLETQLNEVKADNKATKSRIETSTNLNDIKTSAINDLGMVYATSNQIVYYKVNTSDYMSQYYDIP